MSTSLETSKGRLFTRDAIRMIFRSMLTRFYGVRPEFDSAIEAAFQKHFGAKIRRRRAHETIPAIYTEGPPGHGKTTAHIEAAKLFAKELDLGFKMRPSRHEELGPKDFYFVEMNVNGASSPMEVGGLVAKHKDPKSGQEYMCHIPDWKLAKIQEAAFSYVFLDDFPTASYQVQNALLSFLEEGVAGEVNINKGNEKGAGVSVAAIGLAGNMGVADFNIVNRPASAISNRVERYHVEDTIQDWSQRAIDNHPDDLGDVYMTSYLKQYPDYFSMLPEAQEGDSQFPTPRSNDKFMYFLRDFWDEARQKGLDRKDTRDELLINIQRKAEGLLGTESAAKIAAFYRGIVLSAEPIARKILATGEAQEKEISQRLKSGQSADGVDFGFSLAASIGNLGASKIAELFPEKAGVDATKHKKALEGLTKVTYNMGLGLYQLDPTMVSYGFDHFLKRLAVQRPKLFEMVEGGMLIPETAPLEAMVYGLFDKKNPYFDEKRSEALVTKLSSWDRFADTKTGMGKLMKDLAPAAKAHAAVAQH
jgi:hypothetical protein